MQDSLHAFTRYAYCQKEFPCKIKRPNTGDTYTSHLSVCNTCLTLKAGIQRTANVKTAKKSKAVYRFKHPKSDANQN